MNEKQFIETYCHKCGTQRCEGIGTEWFEGCPKRWNLDGYGDPAAEIERLNNKIMELANTIIKLQQNKSRCRKCFHEGYCNCDRDYEGKCPDYKRDTSDGGYYG